MSALAAIISLQRLSNYVPVDEDVRVARGCDRSITGAHQPLRGPSMRPRQAGAKGAGMSDKLGQPQPGFAADFSIIDLNDPSLCAAQQRRSASWSLPKPDAVSKTVVIDGKVVVDQRKVVSIDRGRAVCEKLLNSPRN